MVRRKAVFIDADYTFRDGQTYARLLVKGRKTTRLLYAYDPYFYTDAIAKRDDIAKFAVRKNGEIITVKRVEEIEKQFGLEKRRLLKIVCNKPSDVVALRDVMPFKCFEHGIHYGRRFMLDFNIAPFSIVHYEREGKKIQKFLKIEQDEKKEAEAPLSRMAFDIETYNPLGAPRERKDPAIMVSYSDGNRRGVITYKKCGRDFVNTVADEKAMLAEFENVLNESDPDILYGYNSSNFDLPYLQARAVALKTHFHPGRDKRPFRPMRKGMINGAKVGGRVHIDLYPAIRFFGFIGLIKAQEFTLQKIYEEVTGKKKKMVQRLNIWETWDSGKLEELAEYSLGDSDVTLELGEELLPLLTELSRLTRMPLFDTSLATSGQLVESYLMQESVLRNEIIPSKPSESEAAERQKNPIEGAFVKLPAPGIYENIAVFDFRGLYPSIIISYNIDPTRLVKDGTGGDVFLSPEGHKFLKGPKGLIPSTLEVLLDLRAGIKRSLKTLRKGSEEYKKAHARSHALKILANSFYGYLGYARSRWYNRQCAESVTAWGRMHIVETIEKAEQAGFNVIYGDTDSIFLIYKSKDEVLKFLDDINKNLPQKMELELENFYSRGVFVAKKQEEEKGAKKKYAMLAEDGSIKIRGFELVRRDWSKVAKDTQYRVLEAILKEGSKEKAVAIVRETIEKLKGGKVPIAELAIYTQLTKRPEDYDIVSPELMAAKKAIAKGMQLERGSMIAYVITKRGSSISDRAELADYATDYDADYYINNQVLPAVMKILKELGYSEDDLKNRGRQSSISSFFGN